MLCKHANKALHRSEKMKEEFIPIRPMIQNQKNVNNLIHWGRQIKRISKLLLTK
jgi:hypothetical protein